MKQHEKENNQLMKKQEEYKNTPPQKNKAYSVNPLELHNQLTDLVKTERKIMHEVLMCILRIDTSKSYLDLGYGSLFDYLTLGQGYEEGSAQRRISATRLIKEIPEVAIKIRNGKLKLTQVSRLAVALNQKKKIMGKAVSLETKIALVNKIESLNLEQTQKLLVKELNLPIKKKEEVTVQADGSYYLGLNFSAEQYEKLKHVQSLLSHVKHDANYVEVIDILFNKCIKAYEGKGPQDQNNKSKRKAQPKKEESNNTAVAEVKVNTATTAVKPEVSENPISTTETKNQTQQLQTERAGRTPDLHGVRGGRAPISHGWRKNFEDTTKPTESPNRKNSGATKGQRPYIPKETNRQLHTKANHRCEYISHLTGKRCNSNYQLQIDHIIPIAKGGNSTQENLRILCRNHNLAEARKWGLHRPK